jgi:SP family arabinose:H+ symporter-like MFS transporter
MYPFLISFVAAIGGFLFGYDLVIISGALLYLEEHFQLDDSALGFATASAIIGCIIGPIVGMWLCDRWGRKSTLFVCAFLLAVSAVGTAIPPDITIFNLFRIVGGVGVGLASVASPMYIAEISPARIRGQLVLMYQMAVLLGCSIAVLVAYGLAVALGPASWRWMFASEIVPILCFGLMLPFLPRSPRWLASQGRKLEALAVLTRINGPEVAREELAGIEHSLAEESGSWSELFQPGVRVALWIGILLAIFNQLTGWSGIAFYLPKIFQAAGWTEKTGAILQTLVMQGAGIFLTAISIWLVDRVGRKALWNVTSAAMVFAMVLAGFVFFYGVTGRVVLLAIVACAVPHMLGLGPLPWLVISEIQPTRVRAKAVALSTTVLWIAAFFGTYLFPWLAGLSEEWLGSIAGLFWLYAGISALSLLFGLTLLPETKGKTLEEISELWLNREGSLQSSNGDQQT